MLVLHLPDMARLMNSIIHQWAKDWGHSPNTVLDLLERLGMGYAPEAAAFDTSGWSETAISNKVRLDAAKAGVLSWRNNVGAMQDESGRVVRYGLCNDSKKLNEEIKSADLIGVAPRLITPDMVGSIIGQFWSREVKEASWVYTGTPHERAQAKWASIITSKGGDAKFTTGAL